MNKKILLIEPKSSSANVFSFFSFLPLLGPLYLGTLLKNNGYNVQVINENLLKKELAPSDLNADILLLTCLTSTVGRGYEIAKMFKTFNPSGKVMMGGPHVSFIKDKEQEIIDHIISGEGENIILDLIKYGSSEKYIKGSPVADLDSLPFIDWDILHNSENISIYPIMTSRGCPFDCNFCSVTEMFGKKFRAMSSQRVIEEVKRTKGKDIFFYDDNFTANKKRAHEIMDGLAMMERRSWTAQVRSDIVKDSKLVEKMNKSGCDRVYIGFESINPKTLDTLKKSQTPNDVKNAITTLHRNKIKVHGMFMFGSDYDDYDVIKMTDTFVKKNKVDSVQYMVLTPLPGTQFYYKMEKEGRLIHKNWEHYDGLHVVFWPKNFTPIDLQTFSIDSFKSFYSLINAGNEVINLFADRIVSTVGLAFNRSRKHTYSIHNALLKAAGRIIIKRWNKINRSYLVYLQALSKSGVKQ